MKKSKKLFSIIMVLIILLSSTNSSWASSPKVNVKFKDIKATDWYYQSVTNLTSKGIIGGYTDNTFRPNKEVTTAEFIRLSLETAGIKSNYTVKPWHKDLMQKALDIGIINKTLYEAPDNSIKRKDVALVLTKLIEKTDLKDEFITGKDLDYDRFKYLLYDTTKLSQEYRSAIYKLFEYQLIVGTTNNKDQVFYNPDSNLTRAEIAAIIERLIEPSKRLDKYVEYPNRDSIFLHENIDKMTTTAFHIKPDIENQRFLYTYDEDKGKIEDVILSEKLNPNINRQIYELTKATIDKDNNYYVAVTPGFYNTKDNKITYQVAKTRLHALNDNEEWRFIFGVEQGFNVKEGYFDSPYKNLSTNSIITLNLDSLWQDFAPSGWVDYLYASKLRMSFIALFGEKDGHDIYEYVLNEYIKYRLAGSNESTGNNYIYRTKEIGNIHIDYITGDNAILKFYFSYK